jgi:hypothetical protein
VRHPSHPWIDIAEAPLYVMRFPAHATDAQIREFCEHREAWARTASHRCAWVADLSRLAGVSATQRKMFADHLKRFEAHDVAHNQGSAIVVPSAVLRGIMTAVFWLSPPKFPNQAFASIDAAMLWARQKLAESTAPSQRARR